MVTLRAQGTALGHCYKISHEGVASVLRAAGPHVR
jgi:hypothetical protein